MRILVKVRKNGRKVWMWISAHCLWIYVRFIVLYHGPPCLYVTLAVFPKRNTRTEKISLVISILSCIDGKAACRKVIRQTVFFFTHL